MHTSTPTSADPRRWIALVALSAAVLLVACDVTVLAVAMPDIARELEPTATEALWISDVYSFVLAGLLITMGNLGDRWGRKKLLLWGCTAFGITSIIAAFSPTSEALLLSRVLMGIAGATLMPSTLSLIRTTFEDPRERTFAIGIWSAMGAAGEAIGPIVGGICLAHFWWGSVFLINVPIVIVIVAVGAYALRESKDPNPGRLDAISIVLSIVGMFAIVGAIKEIAVGGVGGTTMWLVFVAGLVILGLFAWRQTRIPNPLIDVRLFRIPAFSGAVVANLLSMFALAGMLFLVSADFQLVAGWTPLQTGMHLLPATAGAIIAAPLAGRFLPKWGRRAVIGGGLALAAIGSYAYAFDPQSGGIWGYLGLGCIGVGAGFALTGTADAIVATAPSDRAGAASAVSETAYELGTALGIAVLGTIATAYYRHSLSFPPGIPESVQTAVETSLADGAEKLSSSSTQAAAAILEMAQEAFSHAVVVSSIVAGVVLTAGAIFAFFVLPSRAKDRAPSGTH